MTDQAPGWMTALITLVGVLTTLIVTIANILKTNKIGAKTDNTHDAVNGRMTELLEKTAENATLKATRRRRKGPWKPKPPEPPPIPGPDGPMPPAA